MYDFLNDRDSIEWARDIYGLPKSAKSFILYCGNSFDFIEWFTVKNPNYNATGNFILKA